MICFSDTRKCTVIFSVSLDLLFGSFFSIKRKERTLWRCEVITEAIYSRITPRSSFACRIARAHVDLPIHLFNQEKRKNVVEAWSYYRCHIIPFHPPHEHHSARHLFTLSLHHHLSSSPRSQLRHLSPIDFPCKIRLHLLPALAAHVVRTNMGAFARKMPGVASRNAGLSTLAHQGPIGPGAPQQKSNCTRPGFHIFAAHSPLRPLPRALCT